MSDAKKDSGAILENDGSWKTRFAYHFFTTFIVNSITCIGTLVLWSSLFFGHQAFEFLTANSWLSLLFLANCAAIILTLYMLDFFWPVHHHEVFALWEGDRFVGRTALGLATVLFLMACYLRTEDFVSLPLLISICLSPMVIYASHTFYDPFKPPELKRRASEIVQAGGVEEKMRLLKRITGEETNEGMFYAGCAATFGAWFVINVLIFALWTIRDGPPLAHLTEGLTGVDRDAKYVQWAAPLVMAIANLVYCLFAVLRLIVQGAYNRTDTYRNRLIADLSESTMIKEMNEHCLELHIRGRHDSEEIEHGESLEVKQRKYLEQHTAMVNQLSTILKGVVCLFIVLLGLCYGARQMLYASTHVASMVAGTMAVFFLIFCIFAYVSLFRVVRAMGQWMLELPAWKSFNGMLTNPWVRAGVLCPFTPLIPWIMLLSLVNQWFRKCRGVYSFPGVVSSSGGPLARSEDSQASENPETLLLTPRVWKKLALLRTFQWLEIMPKIYTLCLCYFAYTICPPPLNVALAWMNNAIEQAEIHYALILLAIFVIGIICFLLPTVPGAVMYMFGGLVSAAHCPFGFWWGAIISIFVGLLMKLVACAVQQEGIGGLMGRSLVIRQTAGVHKTMVRSIEHVLRDKGFTAGKVAILCGGPDWPTSVLAGILRLPLLEMEIGTLPIIGFITPFGLSGSLRLKSGESAMWENSAQLMLVSAFLVNLILWALAGWACQQALEKNRWELTRPLPQNVDLEWLDYRAKCIKDALSLTWKDVPLVVRGFWIWGAVTQITVCYCFCFLSSYLVGSFQLNDDLSKLTFASWDVEQSLFSYLCLGIIAMYFVAWAGHWQYLVWLRRKTKVPLAEATKRIDQEEAAWKQEYLRRCEICAKSGPNGASAEKESIDWTPPVDPPPPPPADPPSEEGDKASTRKRTREDRHREQSPPRSGPKSSSSGASSQKDREKFLEGGVC